MKKTDEDPKEAFQRIVKRANALGVPPEQLAKLPIIKELRANKRYPWVKQWLRYFLVAYVIFQATLLFVWLTEWPVSKDDIIHGWFDFQSLDADREPCIIELSESVLDVTRPPVDCAICRGISEADRVERLSQKDFEEIYAYSGRPVVITDGMKSWTAQKTFSFDFFKGIYGQDSPVLQNMEMNCQFFPYKTNFLSLGEVFNMSKERAQLKEGAEPWYIGWSNCDAAVANILRQHYERPYFIPDVAESSKTDWIFMGSPGYGAHMHIDNVGNPSWQAQITGTKVWTVEPPPECYYECPESSFQVTVNPGEIIVLDTNRWFHATLITGNEMSITIGSEYD